MALGSVLATVLLSKDVALVEGVLALTLLIFLQCAITWASVRLPWLSRAIKSEPTVLVHRGAFIDRAMRSQRMTHKEVLAALRGEGVGGVEEVEAVILETDGSISVIAKSCCVTKESALAKSHAAEELSQEKEEAASESRKSL